MIKSITDTLNSAYRKYEIKESECSVGSVQKILKLFGYPNATNQRYICCLNDKPRIDIHKYSISGRNFIMCLITNNEHKPLGAALWALNNQKVWDEIQLSSFTDINLNDAISSIDELFNRLTDSKYSLVLKY